MRITKFRLWHIFFIRHPQRRYARRAAFDRWLARGEAWAGWEGWRLAGIGGVTHSHGHCGEAWLLLCEGRTNPYFLARACKAKIAEAAAIMKLWRIQATTLAACPKSRKFAEAMGFEPEAFMPGYGPNGEPYHLMVRYYG